MTTYATDFTEYTLNAQPSDWTKRWATSASPIEVRDVSGTTVLFMDAPNGNEHGLSWDDIDSDANRDNVEVYCEVRFAALTAAIEPNFGPFVRANADRDGYYVGPSSSSGFRLRKVNDSTESTLVTQTGLSIALATWYGMLLQVTGTTIRGRMWDLAGSEPGTWGVSVTDSDISAAGWVGLMVAGAGAEPEIRFFGAGTNGDAAPRTLGGGDVTAPVLSSPTGTTTSDTTATVGATTDEGNGTLYAFVSTSATPPSGTDLKAGTGATWAGSVSVSSTGAKTLNATGLTASTGYYAHLIHTDAAANDSNIVTSAQFTTDAAASPPGTPSTPAFDNITKTGYRVTWSAPGSGGTVSGYEYRINAGSWVDLAAALEVTVTGRTPGATDTVEVRAYGPGGAGTASTADITLPLYGFAFSTASGLVFGAIVGALTGLARETEAAEWTVFVHDDVDRELLLTSSPVTIDAAGRLPDMTSATLDAGVYFLGFRRTSDGAWAAARIATEDLS